MSRDLKRALYRLLMLVIAIVLKILIVQDLFLVALRAVMGYNNLSSLLAIILSSLVTGILIGEAMFCHERDDPHCKQNAIEYFDTHEFSKKNSRRYILHERGELVDFIIFALITLVLIAAMYTVRVVTTDWKYAFEALIVCAVLIPTEIFCELFEKYKLYYEWTHKNEFEEE